MIDQVIRPWLRPFRRAEVDSIFLAHILDLVPAPRQSDNSRVELLEVCFQYGGGVAGGVAGDEKREERTAVWGWRGGEEGGGGDAGGLGRRDEVDHAGEFVEFFGANVGAVGEAEVDLWGGGET